MLWIIEGVCTKILPSIYKSTSYCIHTYGHTGTYGQSIHIAHEFKDLGVVVNDRLTFTPHIKSVHSMQINRHGL